MKFLGRSGTIINKWKMLFTAPLNLYITWPATAVRPERRSFVLSPSGINAVYEHGWLATHTVLFDKVTFLKH